MLPVFQINVPPSLNYSGSVLVAAEDATSALELLSQIVTFNVDESFLPVVVENLMWQGDPAIVKNCLHYEDYWPGA